MKLQVENDACVHRLEELLSKNASLATALESMCELAAGGTAMGTIEKLQSNLAEAKKTIEFFRSSFGFSLSFYFTLNLSISHVFTCYVFCIRP